MVGLHNDNMQLKVALHITFKQGFNRSQVPGKICWKSRVAMAHEHRRSGGHQISSKLQPQPGEVGP